MLPERLKTKKTQNHAREDKKLLAHDHTDAKTKSKSFAIRHLPPIVIKFE
jgi:hypothetical protein